MLNYNIWNFLHVDLHDRVYGICLDRIYDIKPVPLFYENIHFFRLIYMEF